MTTDHVTKALETADAAWPTLRISTGGGVGRLDTVAAIDLERRRLAATILRAQAEALKEFQLDSYISQEEFDLLTERIADYRKDAEELAP